MVTLTKAGLMANCLVFEGRAVAVSLVVPLWPVGPFSSLNSHESTTDAAVMCCNLKNTGKIDVTFSQSGVSG